MIFDGVKVFSATRSGDRERLGEKLEAWSRAHPELEVVDTKVMQSSDEAHHCMSFVVFYREDR